MYPERMWDLHCDQIQSQTLKLFHMHLELMYSLMAAFFLYDQEIELFKSWTLHSFVYWIISSILLATFKYVIFCLTLCYPITAACQASLSFAISQSLLKFMFIVSVIISNHPFLCCLFSFCLPSFPPSGPFPMSQLYAWGGQSIETSASAAVLPMNIQNSFLSGLTDLISLQSLRDS